MATEKLWVIYNSLRAIVTSLIPILTKNTLPQGEPGTSILLNEFLLAPRRQGQFSLMFIDPVKDRILRTHNYTT